MLNDLMTKYFQHSTSHHEREELIANASKTKPHRDAKRIPQNKAISEVLYLQSS